jgi:hypothetical protein
VHYFIYMTGRVRGFAMAGGTSEQTHLLLPGSTRALAGTAPAPVLPGIYKLNYGYATDTATGAQTNRSEYFLNLPPWSIALVLVASLLLRMRYLRRKKKDTTSATD